MGNKADERNRLIVLYPEIAAQWHPTLNAGLSLEEISPHSNKKVYWLCERGHTFEKTPDKRVAGQGCPYCSNRRLLVGYNDLETRYPQIAAEWDPENNEGTPRDYTFRAMYKAHWICSKCGNRWEASIRDRVDAKYQTCPVCTLAKRGETKHKAALQKSGHITDPVLLAEWDYEKNERGPEDYTPACNEEVFWICSKCGYHFKAVVENRVTRRSCACCSGKVVVPGVNDLATTHPALAAEWHPTKNEKSPTQVTHGLADKVWWICPEGHEYQASLLHRSGGTGCPICNKGRQTSFAEQAVFFYVKKVFPDAINSYREIFDNGMELDIYIPSIRLGIEYDGEAWHKTETLERDKKKYQICQEHGIKLLRLKEKLSPSDRGTADEFLSIEGRMYQHKLLEIAIRLLLDEIDPETNRWTRKKPIFHSRVSVDLKRDKAEIRKYMGRLNSGSLADLYPDLAKEWHPTENGTLTPDKVLPHSGIKATWICPTCGNVYQAVIQSRTAGTGCAKCGILKCAKSNQKKVEMLDPETGEVLRSFDSITEASKELSINSSNISMVCKGTRKRAGAYGWRYLDEK